MTFRTYYVVDRICNVETIFGKSVFLLRSQEASKSHRSRYLFTSSGILLTKLSRVEEFVFKQTGSMKIITSSRALCDGNDIPRITTEKLKNIICATRC